MTKVLVTLVLLLTPVVALAWTKVAVPEPGTLGLLAAGLAPLAWRMLRR